MTLADAAQGAQPRPRHDGLHEAWSLLPGRARRVLLVLGADAEPPADPGRDLLLHRLSDKPPPRLNEPERSIDAAVLFNAARPDGSLPRLLEEVQRVLRAGGPVLFIQTPARRRTRPLRAAVARYFQLEGSRRLGRGTLLLQARVRRTQDVIGHFEQLAPEYAGEIPPHLARHYLEQKLAMLARAIPDERAGLLGLDLGTGLGQYAHAVGPRFAARVLGVDASRPGLRLARKKAPPGVQFLAADSVHLPMASGRFDFAYAVNLLHHLKRGEQERALWEIHRVLRPGAPFVLFEINVRNPLFRWYMRNVFPRTRRIDRGDEEFIHPDRLPLIDGFRVERIDYATFVPDFVPGFLLPAARWLERRLEASRWRGQAIHYGALLRRLP